MDEKAIIKQAIKEIDIQITNHIELTELKIIGNRVSAINPKKICYKTNKNTNPQISKNEQFNHHFIHNDGEKDFIDISIDQNTFPTLTTEFAKVNALVWSFGQTHKENHDMTLRNEQL